MAEKALDVYLNDHLGGSMLGTDLAKQIRDGAEGTPLGEKMTRIAADIEDDQEVLLHLMELLDVSRNPVKQATGWIAEKASRVKFSGVNSGEPDHGLFMAIETLRLGVAGKRCLWLALQKVQADYPALHEVDLETLIQRASGQLAELESERIALARPVLSEGSRSEPVAS